MNLEVFPSFPPNLEGTEHTQELLKEKATKTRHRETCKGNFFKVGITTHATDTSAAGTWAFIAMSDASPVDRNYVSQMTSLSLLDDVRGTLGHPIPAVNVTSSVKPRE